MSDQQDDESGTSAPPAPPSPPSDSGGAGNGSASGKTVQGGGGGTPDKPPAPPGMKYGSGGELEQRSGGVSQDPRVKDKKDKYGGGKKRPPSPPGMKYESEKGLKVQKLEGGVSQDPRVKAEKQVTKKRKEYAGKKEKQKERESYYKIKKELKTTKEKDPERYWKRMGEEEITGYISLGDFFAGEDWVQSSGETTEALKEGIAREGYAWGAKELALGTFESFRDVGATGISLAEKGAKGATEAIFGEETIEATRDLSEKMYSGEVMKGFTMTDEKGPVGEFSKGATKEVKGIGMYLSGKGKKEDVRAETTKQATAATIGAVTGGAGRAVAAYAPGSIGPVAYSTAEKAVGATIAGGIFAGQTAARKKPGKTWARAAGETTGEFASQVPAFMAGFKAGQTGATKAAGGKLKQTATRKIARGEYTPKEYAKRIGSYKPSELKGYKSTKTTVQKTPRSKTTKQVKGGRIVRKTKYQTKGQYPTKKQVKVTKGPGGTKVTKQTLRPTTAKQYKGISQRPSFLEQYQKQGTPLEYKTKAKYYKQKGLLSKTTGKTREISIREPTAFKKGGQVQAAEKFGQYTGPKTTTLTQQAQTKTLGPITKSYKGSMNILRQGKAPTTSFRQRQFDFVKGGYKATGTARGGKLKSTEYQEIPGLKDLPRAAAEKGISKLKATQADYSPTQINPPRSMPRKGERWGTQKFKKTIKEKGIEASQKGGSGGTTKETQVRISRTRGRGAVTKGKGGTPTATQTPTQPLTQPRITSTPTQISIPTQATTATAAGAAGGLAGGVGISQTLTTPPRTDAKGKGKAKEVTKVKTPPAPPAQEKITGQDIDWDVVTKQKEKTPPPPPKETARDIQINVGGEVPSYDYDTTITKKEKKKKEISISILGRSAGGSAGIPSWLKGGSAKGKGKTPTKKKRKDILADFLDISEKTKGLI